MAIITSSGSVRVVVYDSRIQAMSAPGGDVFRYAQHKAQRAAAYGKAFAPKRTGALAAGIRSDTRTVVQGAVGRARSTARHSAWVHEGTYGPIVATHSPEGMWVPRRKFGFRRGWRQEVAGQRANPFLDRALSAAMKEPYFMAGARLTGNPF